MATAWLIGQSRALHTYGYAGILLVARLSAHVGRKKYNRNANELVRRCVSVMEILVERNVLQVLGNPSGSTLFHMHEIKQVTESMDCFEEVVWLGAFGAPSPKPIRLKGNHPAIMRLREYSLINKPPPGVLETLVDVDGEKVSGRKEELRNSAYYPGRFCEMIARTHVELCEFSDLPYHNKLRCIVFKQMEKPNISVYLHDCISGFVGLDHKATSSSKWIAQYVECWGEHWIQ